MCFNHCKVPLNTAERDVVVVVIIIIIIISSSSIINSTSG